MNQHLKELCELDGVSGREDVVRKYIEKEIPEDCSYYVDNLGDIIGCKPGRGKSAKKIMVEAHMDEVGMMLTYAMDDGRFKFAPVGGIVPAVLAGKQVRIQPGNTKGVIGFKPYHLSTPEDRKKDLTIDDLYIDIGAKNKEEALKIAKPGYFAVFASSFVELGQKKCKAKAIDDRFGCALLLRLLHQTDGFDFDLYFAFNTREEVGQHGAIVSSAAIKPDIAIVLEATSAGDLPGVSENRKVCKIGCGPVISFMDRGTIYDKKLYDYAMELADKKGIPCQTKTAVAGANDAQVISKSQSGVRCLAMSLPCRYIHSGASVGDREDMENCFKLLKAILQSPDLLMI